MPARNTSSPLAFVEMTGPDTRMDEGANRLPVGCLHCTLPDLDFVSEPYLLARGFSAPAETAPAEVGNFLVRRRVRDILERVIPGACTFIATAERKSGKPTDWFLAIPTAVIDMPGLAHRSADGARCSKCGEPKLGYYPWQPDASDPKGYRHVGLENLSLFDVEVFKPRQWFAIDTAENQYAQAVRYNRKQPPPWSDFGRRHGVNDPPPHEQRWTRINLNRDLFFSARLDLLLARAGVKGQLVRTLRFKHVRPSADDLAWIDSKLQLLGGAAPKPAGPASSRSAARKWLTQYLKKHRPRKKGPAPDFPAFEKKHGLKLPDDYKAFIAAAGPSSFENVMEIEGFTTRVLPPSKLDAKTFRRGRWKKLGVESDADAVGFASTDHGDAFLFDVSDPSGDWPVLWYDHEQNTLEPFAPGFAACIRRFHERT